MTSCLLSCTPVPFEKGSTLNMLKGKKQLPIGSRPLFKRVWKEVYKRKNLLQMGLYKKRINSLLFEYTPFQKGAKTVSTELSLLKVHHFLILSFP